MLNKSINILAAVVGVSIGIFHLLHVSGIMTFSSMTFRATHLMAMLILVFLLYPKNQKELSMKTYIIKITGVFFSIFTGFYVLYRWQNIISSGGRTNSTDTIVAVTMVILVLIATVRAINKSLAIIAFIFVLYPFFGYLLPGFLHARQYGLERVFNFLFVSTQGIYGIPISVSANYIILFCMYGAFLSEFGAGDFMFDLSRTITSKMVAATAKTAVIFSTLIGMVSGSAAGNVAVTGALTIPMMKREGYDNNIAASISALASTGGQLMPPIMGAAAFIMAQLINKPYIFVAKSAIIPALLYFSTVFIIVHLLYLRGDIGYKHDEEKKDLLIVIKKGWFYIIPLFTLVYMLVIGFSPFKAVYYSIVVLVVVFTMAFRDFSFGYLKKIVNAIKVGSYNTVPIAIATAASGVIVGIIGLTGIGSKLVNFIVVISGGQLLVALVLTMITSIILGMGLPTTAAYLIPAVVVAPALIELGLTPISAHMFIFFYACISTITPPVALSSYVAAGIAGAEVNKVGWTAFRYGLPVYVLPFMFVFNPGLLFQGSIFQVITAAIFGFIGVVCLASSIIGYFKKMLSPIFRILFAISGLLLVYQGLINYIIGLMIIIISLFILNKYPTLKENE